MSAHAPMSTLEFLESLTPEPQAAVSPVERAQIQAWAVAHPDALGALVSRTLGLQGELALARREIDRLERARRLGQPSVPSQDELRRQSDAWDTLLGTSAGRRVPVGGRDAAGPQVSMSVPVPVAAITPEATPAWGDERQNRPGLPSRAAPRGSSSRTFEDIGVRFLTENAGKVWLALALVSALVVFIRERGV